MSAAEAGGLNCYLVPYRLAGDAETTYIHSIAPSRIQAMQGVASALNWQIEAIEAIRLTRTANPAQPARSEVQHG